MATQKKARVNRRQFLRLASIGAGGVLAASTLGACGPTPTATPAAKPTAPPAAKPTDTPAAKPTVAETVTLRYQNHWTVEADCHYRTMLWVYKTFQERNPDIKLDVVVIPAGEESTRKIIADCGTGNCPDIVHEVYLNYYDAGWIMDLAPYIDAEWKGRLIPEILEEVSWEGKIFGVSAEYSPMPCCWNMKVLDQLGKSIPKTWDELLALGEACKSKGLYLTAFEAFALMGFTAILFGRPGAADSMAKGQWKCEQVLYAFKRLKEIIDNKLNPPNDVELEWRQACAMWTTGRFPLAILGAWHIGKSITAEGVDPDFRNHVVFSPVPSTGHGTTMQVMNATALGLGSHLLKNQKKLDAAIKFLRFITSDESAMMFITDAQSPTGVKATIPRDKVPILAAFMDSVKKADIVFSLPRNKKLRALAWEHPIPGYQALLLGKSAEEATEIYAAEMSK